MFVYTSYFEVKENAPYCIALGSFDGVHVGHLKLIESIATKAKELNCRSMIYTFSEHPKKIFFQDSNLDMITDDKLRMEIFEKYNLDSVYLEDFLNIKNLNPEEFVKKILLEKFQIKCVVAGYNFKFGLNKSGNIEILKTLGRKYGFDVLIIEPVIIDGKIVSSSFIRELLKSGEVEIAKKYLGRYFSIKGPVIHGKKKGSKIGIRTANISIKEDLVLPKKGVYLTDTIIDGISYKSVTNIGYNPTFKGNKISIETHVISYNNYLYDTEVEVVFLKWRREEKCYDTVDELKQQINSDIESRLALNT